MVSDQSGDPAHQLQAAHHLRPRTERESSPKDGLLFIMRG